MLSWVQLFVTPWTVAQQAPLSMGIFRQEHEWVAISFPWGSSPPRDWACVSHVTWNSRWIFFFFFNQQGFPGSSAGKESTCNAGNPSSIPGSGRSPGEAMGYPFQYSQASLGAQIVKNLLTMWKTWVWCLGWEEPLGEGMATHSSIRAWRIPMDRGSWQATVHGVLKESDTNNHWDIGGSSMNLVTFLQTWRLNLLCLIGP